MRLCKHPFKMYQHSNQSPPDVLKRKISIMQTVLIAGGSGMIGTRISEILEEKGYRVWHLSRKADSTARFPKYRWDYASEYIDLDALEAADYLLNLSGAGVADRPWTASRKRIITESRTKGNFLLKAKLQELGKLPKAYISASAIGYYGNRGDQWVDETATSGTGFLSESCIAWEEAIQEVASLGLRTVVIRIGIVLSPKGGALPKLMMTFKARFGTYFGDGQMYYSWIHLDDIANIFVKAIEDQQMAGIYNGVAPHPETNKALTEAISEATGNSNIIIPSPKFTIRLAMGEMADTVLDSTRVSADKIQKAGFTFAFPKVEPALMDLIGEVKQNA